MRARVVLVGIAICLFVVGLSGCAKREVQREINAAELLLKPFTCTAKVRCGELEATIRLIREAPGCTQVDFTSPHALKELSVRVATGEVSMYYGELNVLLPLGVLPEGAIPSLLAGVLDATLREDSTQTERKGEELVVTGNAEFGTYTLILNAKSGKLVSLSIPACGFTANFFNFTQESEVQK